MLHLEGKGQAWKDTEEGRDRVGAGCCSLCCWWWGWAGGSETGAQVLGRGGVLRLRGERSRWDRDKGTDLGVGDSVETGDGGGGN